MSDHGTGRASSLEAPARGGFAVTPNDSAALVTTTRALYVGSGGTLAVEMQDGTNVQFENVPDGALLPLRASKVLAATTASAIIGLY